MKRIMTVLIIPFLVLGSVGMGWGSPSEPFVSARQAGESALSVKEHLAKARYLGQKIEQLTEKVEQLKKQVTTYEQKPYLDTKGVRVNGLKVLIGTTIKDISSMREQVAWHQDQASKLADLNTLSGRAQTESHALSAAQRVTKS